MAFGAIVAAAAVAAVVLSGVLSGASSSHAHAPSAAGGGAPRVSTPAVLTRSPSGLPLGHPPLALGLGDTRDPVHLRFAHEPRSGLLFNLDNGRVLWRRDPQRRMPIASLTKMMTGLLVVQRSPPYALVRITPQALAYHGSGVGVLPKGKAVRAEALLNGLMLPSGNDAAIALAQHVSGTVPRFVTQMNLAAARLGLGCTRYSSPHGFEDRGNFSCASDLAVLAHADLALPRLARVVRRRQAVLPFPIKGGRLFLYNNNPLIRLGYPGVTGLKTGYTAAAGRCLVVTAERHGVRLGVVLLHSPDPPTQARQLLDRGFEGVYRQAPQALPATLPPLKRPHR